VWGPPGSFIADNNEFALALVMTVPLLRFLHLQAKNVWLKRVLLLMMILCAVSALGSHSRGALLAIIAMAAFLWLKGKNKLPTALLLVVAGTLMVAFMPDEWTARMQTIDNFQEDRSAMGRISAWWAAWNIAWHYPLGVGFNPARPDLFARFSPYPDYVHAAHSIYFQALGNHGFPGLFAFLAIWLATWRSASWILREAPKHAQARWCVDLAAMCQVSLVAYAVGGAFLSLAYFDLPYNIMVLVVATRFWLQHKRWQTESDAVPRWMRILGIEATSSPLSNQRAAK
jgi:probable O-glycosylation ligase (exosortase A-associated)